MLNFKSDFNYEVSVPLEEGLNKIILTSMVDDENNWEGPAIRKSKRDTEYIDVPYRIKGSNRIKHRTFFQINDSYIGFDMLVNALMKAKPDKYKSVSQVLQETSEVRNDVGNVVSKGIELPIWVAHVTSDEVNPASGKPYQNIQWFYTQESYDNRNSNVKEDPEIEDLNL